MKDTYRHKGMRRQLVADLRKKGIADPEVLDAMGSLPRHFFLDAAFDEWAYRDKAFPIGNDQTISQPYTVAYQTELLEVEKRQKILEIGTGSGYQAAVLAMLGARVYTVERQEWLYRRARRLLQALDMQGVRCFFRDGKKGLPEHGPFDRILVTAAAEEIPKTLCDQLCIGGILVVPVGEEEQQMYRILRLSENEFHQEKKGKFRFVPFLPGKKRI
ncbi:MAG: protein-L-isoaspartate(D-aspartate) O-methyltransferase [Saprospiraceae bacterium]|nr:protein-L-isoaspartate(D-aspartate) O-methyltransferase [Saprospiraceae bacterium]